MKIKISCSPKMTERNEFELIRIPKSLRETLGVEPQSLLVVKNGNKVLRLRVRMVFQEDLDTQGNKAFVSEQNYELLAQRSGKLIVEDVVPFKGLSIGCDPEFFLVNQKTGDIQLAKHIMAHKMNTPLGLRVGEFGYLGNDGAPALAEIRPDPVMLGNTPRLVNNIANLILALRKNRVISSRITRAEAHSYYAHTPAGFHIHLGLGEKYVSGKGLIDIPDDVDLPRLSKEDRLEILPGLVSKSLDFHLGMLMFQLDPQYKDRSWNSDYGRAGEFRLCKYTVEYRVPGGYFLRTPALTHGLLDTAAFITANTVPLLEAITDGYTPSKVFDRETLESEFNKHLGIPDTMRIKCILDGEETLNDTEMDAVLARVINNMSQMKGMTPPTRAFLEEAARRREESKAAPKKRSAYTFSRKSISSHQPHDLVASWRGV